MVNVLAIIIIIILSFLALMVVPTLMTRRAAKQVINIFRRQNATSAETAKTMDALMLRPPTFKERMFRARDYKPRALDNLIENGIVQSAEDGKLYISEETIRKLEQGL